MADWQLVYKLPDFQIVQNTIQQATVACVKHQLDTVYV